MKQPAYITEQSRGRSVTRQLKASWLIFLFFYSGALRAAESWEVEGSNGLLYVYGTLTESACRLEMDSLHQDIRLEDTGTGRLLNTGDSGTPVLFRIGFSDCLRSDTVRDGRTGNMVEAFLQPVVKVSFSGPRDETIPDLFSVRGASGLGLRIADKAGNNVLANNIGAPLILVQGQNSLYYSVAPVRTSAPLVAGSFSAAIDYKLSYD
ncbi:fimbrial protein [Enterobacter sp. J49]|uniref:fimbrial protein n=1 Tax=Enterobacter sp. J49 TaxID=1903627 RepID=UPI000B716171|nr:fimbrial protein [Enterobacter sp. J49]OUC37006.1 fimbrial protein [Enterobacter sp. J49]